MKDIVIQYDYKIENGEIEVKSSQIERYFRLAKNASEFGDYPRYKIGAIIVYKSRVLSVGWNAKKENPIQKRYNIERGFDVETAKNSLHAEIYAISKIKEMDINWNKVSIFIYREYKNGIRALARPCPACEKAIRDLGIKHVYYTGRNSYIHEILD